MSSFFISYNYENMSGRFFENQPNEICSHLSEKASKGRFLKPEKLQNHSNEGKRKEITKERGEGKEKKKKSNGCTLSYFEVFGRKNCSTQEVHLAITLSKIRLDV